MKHESDGRATPELLSTVPDVEQFTGRSWLPRVIMYVGQGGKTRSQSFRGRIKLHFRLTN